MIAPTTLPPPRDQQFALYSPPDCAPVKLVWCLVSVRGDIVQQSDPQRLFSGYPDGLSDFQLFAPSDRFPVYLAASLARDRHQPQCVLAALEHDPETLFKVSIAPLDIVGDNGEHETHLLWTARLHITSGTASAVPDSVA